MLALIPRHGLTTYDGVRSVIKAGGPTPAASLRTGR
jgi:hypothetical protein